MPVRSSGSRRLSAGRLTLARATHHHAGLEQQVVHCLSDVGSVHQVVVGVLVFAVSHLQRLHEGHQRRDGDLKAEKN